MVLFVGAYGVGGGDYLLMNIKKGVKPKHFASIPREVEMSHPSNRQRV